MTRWSRLDAAADRHLLKELNDGDTDGVARLYDAYAERLYDYALLFTVDVHVARNVVHDALIDATHRAGRLRDRRRLCPWLYAAVRRRGFLLPSTAKPTHDDAPDQADPAGTLDRPQRDVLCLALRHDLEGTELAATLGVPARRARRRLARAQSAAADGRPNAAAPHMFPAVAPPAMLRERVLHTFDDPELAGYRAQIVARGGRLTRVGLPRQPDAPPQLTRHYSVAFAALATVGLLVAVGLRTVGVGPGDPGLVPEPDPSSRYRPRDGATSVRPDAGPTASSRGPADSGYRPAGGRTPDPNGTGARRRTSPAPLSPRLPDRPATSPTGARPSAGPTGRTPSAPHPTNAPGDPGRPPRTKHPSSPGTLTVSPGDIGFGSGGDTATLALTAAGGPVRWSVRTTSNVVSLSDTGGTISAGGTRRITVHLTRGLLQLPGSTSIRVDTSNGPAHRIPVSWSISLL